MDFESVSLRAERLRSGGTRRVGRNSSGFGLIDTLLALLISATLIAPVLGGVLIVLKTAPGAATDSVISGQQATNRQNFELNVASAHMRNDWSEATIVKTPPRTFNSDIGLDCLGGGSGSLGDNSSTKLVVALQVRSFADGANVLKNSKGTGVLKSQGLTRVVYSLVPTQLTPAGQLYDLVRRECAVTTSSPELGELPPNNIPSNANPPGQIPADHGGWRLKPGNFAKQVLVIAKSPDAPSSGQFSGPVCFPDSGVIPQGESGAGQQQQVDWCPTKRTEMTSVKSMVPSKPCNGTEYYPQVVGNPDNGQFGYASESGYPAYNPRCDLNFTVTFGDGRTHTVRLYQGFGF